MPDDLKATLARWRAGDSQAEPELVAQLLPMLRAMAAKLSRASDTPLQFECDAETIARAACAEFSGQEAATPCDWAALIPLLDVLVARTLADESCLIAIETIPGNSVPQTIGAAFTVEPSAGMPTHPLAGWLTRIHEKLRAVQPQALAIFALRIEGSTDRDIAESLQLGLRLVRRILRDARLALASLRTGGTRS